MKKKVNYVLFFIWTALLPLMLAAHLFCVMSNELGWSNWSHIWSKDALAYTFVISSVVGAILLVVGWAVNLFVSFAVDIKDKIKKEK